MEKRLLVAVLLMSAVIMLTNVLFPPPEQTPGGPEGADSVATAVPVAAAPAPVLSAAASAAADTVEVTSDLYRYAFSTRGAALVRAELPEYRSYTRPGEPVQLVPEGVQSFLTHRLVIGRDTLDLSRVGFEPSAPAIRVEEGAEVVPLRFTYQDPSGFAVQITYTFDPNQYLIATEGQVSGLGGRPAVLLTELGPGPAPHEAFDHHGERELAVVSHTGDDVSRIHMTKLAPRDTLAGPLTWAGLKDKYFVAALVAGSERPLSGAVARRLPDQVQRFVDGDDTVSVEFPRATVVTALPLQPDGTFAYQLYLGPQDFDRLGAVGHELEDVTQYAYAWLEPVIRPFAAFILYILSFLHNTLGLAYGWVLVIFGVLMRIVLWPLNAKAMRSQMKNMAVAPMMQEIREKYKDDPEKQQQEMLRIYKEHGFNPLAGCLPMLLPWPVLITLFFVFQNTISFRGAGFLWLPDLSLRDPIYILPIFLVLSMFAMQWVSTVMSGMEQNAQMKMMMYVMPLALGFLFFTLPAGLNLYYATTNVAGLPQQMMIARERRKAQEELKAQNAAAKAALRPTGTTRKKKPGKG